MASPPYLQERQPQERQEFRPRYVPQSASETGDSFVEKLTVLYEAPRVLNKPSRPWTVTIEGDSIIARWNLTDAAFFAPHEINNDIRNFNFIVILDEKGRWKEIAKADSKSGGFKFDTATVKQPIRDYMISCGWKKAGLFV
jgi:hypothetical protein